MYIDKTSPAKNMKGFVTFLQGTLRVITNTASEDLNPRATADKNNKVTCRRGIVTIHESSYPQIHRYHCVNLPCVKLKARKYGPLEIIWVTVGLIKQGYVCPDMTLFYWGGQGWASHVSNSLSGFWPSQLGHCHHNTITAIRELLLVSHYYNRDDEYRAVIFK